MKLKYQYREHTPLNIKTFLAQQKISRKLLARIKFQGGKITVNGIEQNVLYLLQFNDELVITLPPEVNKDELIPDFTPLDILYEDDYLLIVNKPSGVPSVPVNYYLQGTMVNRVKGYLQQIKHESPVVHTVTRLDKDTTGVMLFAKNSYIHSLLDQLMRQKELHKFYYALVHDHSQKILDHSLIDAKIKRKSDSIIERITGIDGQEALTEYWCQADFGDCKLVKVQLHTGRTHQIRVHFRSLDAPLIGDTLYNPYTSKYLLNRQALHCAKLVFNHPVTAKRLVIEAPVPHDMQKVITKWKG